MRILVGNDVAVSVPEAVLLVARERRQRTVVRRFAWLIGAVAVVGIVSITVFTK